MLVQLVAHTVIAQDIPGYVPHADSDDVTHADDLAEQAGRLCYLSWNRPNPKTATNAGYMGNIIAKMHYSVMEHASVTIYLDGVTRNLTHEFIRHRHFGYSEVSQRYCDVGEFPFVPHPGLEKLSYDGGVKIDQAIEAGREAYAFVVTELTSRGLERKEARQAARHALVSGTETKILVSGNINAWRTMLPKRLSPAADAEFREVATEILKIMKQVAPNSFQDFE